MLFQSKWLRIQSVVSETGGRRDREMVISQPLRNDDDAAQPDRTEAVCATIARLLDILRVCVVKESCSMFYFAFELTPQTRWHDTQMA